MKFCDRCTSIICAKKMMSQPNLQLISSICHRAFYTHLSYLFAANQLIRFISSQRQKSGSIKFALTIRYSDCFSSPIVFRNPPPQRCETRIQNRKSIDSHFEMHMNRMEMKLVKATTTSKKKMIKSTMMGINKCCASIFIYRYPSPSLLLFYKTHK